MGIEQLNEKKTVTKNDRQDLILEFLRINDVKKESEILSFLSDQGIKISQPTINKDLKYLGVIKNDFGIYQPNILDRRNKHKHELKMLLKKNNASYYSEVKTIFIRATHGTSQAIAYHLENIFEDIILKSTIDTNSITFLVDAQAFHANDEFQQILKAFNEK